MWWFWREKADEFNQLLGRMVGSSLQNSEDFNNDERIDLVGAKVNKPSTITDVVLTYFENQGSIHLRNCFATDDATNPNNCAFVTKEAVHLEGWIANQWVYQQGRTGVDVNGDGNRDIAALK